LQQRGDDGKDALKKKARI